MKKTVCKVCGCDAQPVYLRVKFEGEKKYQYCRAGEWCLNSECDTIGTDEGEYRKVPPDPADEAKREETRSKIFRAEILDALKELIHDDPEFREMFKKILPVKK